MCFRNTTHVLSARDRISENWKVNVVLGGERGLAGARIGLCAALSQKLGLILHSHLYGRERQMGRGGDAEVARFAFSFQK